MSKNARVDENSDFQQIALPLDLAIGEHILHRSRLEADGEPGGWYELYLLVTPHGFQIEKHFVSLDERGRLKQTWFHRTLPDAKQKYSQILRSYQNHKRSRPNSCKVVNDENQGQQKLFS